MGRSRLGAETQHGCAGWTVSEDGCQEFENPSHQTFEIEGPPNAPPTLKPTGPPNRPKAALLCGPIGPDVMISL